VTVSYANGDQSDSDLSDVHAADADGSSPDFVEDRAPSRAPLREMGSKKLRNLVTVMDPMTPTSIWPKA